ncbi:type I-F CRISPR-associated protein Csy2 [Thaumasiovibrio sp. DFM-14]|uniref:type I-F CRISPR-associated protein Csy2 n=1 Tax=Thaumasiovibrio sp. DFM-14 TaxID=3384792 RepID=UPI0039A1C902
MDIQTLLNDTPPKRIDAALKKHFGPTTPALEVSTNPKQAIVALINLTQPTRYQADLLCRDKCREMLKSEKWWLGCLKAVEYHHSHNVKHPDSRAVGTIRAEPIGALPISYLSSAKLPLIDWHYANNSADVNKSVFLCCDIRWEGQITTLATALQCSKHPLWLSIRSLGCLAKQQNKVLKMLSTPPNRLISVPLAPNYIKQVTYPKPDDGYITLSPVPSQSLQSGIHRALEGNYRLSAIYHLDRATNTGYFAAKAGGRIQILKTVPRIPSDSSSNSFGCHWLTKSRSDALKWYNEHRALLLTKHSQSRQMQRTKSEIDNMLSDWLSGIEDANSFTNTQLAQSFNDSLSRTKLLHQLAYIPELIELFDERFEHLQTDSSLSQKNLVGLANYLVVPHLPVYQAKAENTPYTIGIPSIIGIYGYLHAFERKVRQEFPNFRLNSFALRLNHFHLERRGLSQHATKVCKDGQVKPPALRDSWQADLCLSLLVNFDCNEALPLSEVPRWLPTRLCQGHVHIPHSMQKDITVSTNLTQSIGKLQHQPGLWLTAAPTIPIANITDLIKLATENKLVSCLGYHLLSQPAASKHSLYGHPHAFCEPVVGIVNTVQTIGFHAIDTLFWHYHWAKSGPLLTNNRGLIDEIAN